MNRYMYIQNPLYVPAVAVAVEVGIARGSHLHQLLHSLCSEKIIQMQSL